MAHRMAMRSDVQGAFFDIITNYFNSSDMSADQAAEFAMRKGRQIVDEQGERLFG